MGMFVTRPTDVSEHIRDCVYVCVCVCLTIRKHLDPFLLLVVVARRRALVAGELWTICVGGGLPR